MFKVDHTKNIIELKGIAFGYNNGNENVLDNVTLDIHKGDYIGMVGPNGSGKSTLLKIILNLLTPQRGEIRLFGQDINNFKDWRKIGYVPQKAANIDANFPASVYEVVLMGRTLRGLLFQQTTAADERAVRDALSRVDMWKYKDRLIGDLSGGQQQRVFIARALVNQPEAIFLDEPTTGVDQRAQDDFYALLKKLNREMGLTLILVSHDIERITREVMHIACVDKTLTCHITPAEYLAESKVAVVSGKDVRMLTHHHER